MKHQHEPHRWLTIQGVSVIAIVSLVLFTGCAPEDSASTDDPGLKPGAIGGLVDGSSNRSSSEDTTKPGTDGSSSGSDTKRPPAQFEGEEVDATPDFSGRKPIDVPKSTSLPASFPNARFPVPQDAVIFDAGERSATSWFVVLEFSDVDAARQSFRTLASEADLPVTQDDGDASTGITVAAEDGTAVMQGISTSHEGRVLLSLEFEVLR